MPAYKDASGDSGILSYDLGDDWISVVFKKGGGYLYTYEKPGPIHVVEMRRLAQLGDGLNTYINKFVRRNYQSKLS